MQQCSVCGTLIEWQEDDVGDAREALQGASDLSARVDPQRPRPHLIGDHDDPHGRPDQCAQFGVVAQEA